MADINDLKNRTVSHGTLNPDHLIPAFCDVLKEYAPDKYAEFIKGYPELDDWEDFLEADWRIISDDTKMNASDELFGLLNDIAPEGTMFNSTEGDGSDFGFWSVEEKKEESKDITTLTDLKKFILSKNDNSVVFGVNSTGDLYFVDSVNGKEVPASADSLAVAEDDSDEHGKRIGNQGTGYFVVWKNCKRPTYMTAQQIYDELLKIARSWSVEEKKSEADDDNKDLRIGLYYTEEELAILKDIFKKYVQEISGIRFSVPEDYTISYEISDDPLGDFEAVVKATNNKGKTIYLCNLHGEVLWAVNTPKQFWHYVGQVDPKTGEEKKDKYVIPPRSFFLDDEYYDSVKPSTRIPLLPSDWDKVDDYFKKFFKKRGEGFLDDDEGETALKQMAKGGKSTGEVAADVRYDVATALDMAVDKAEDLMTKFGLDNIYVLRAKGLSPKAIAKRILKACEYKSEAKSDNWVAYYFCEDPQGLEWAVLPHAINGIGNASCVNSRGGNDSIAIEYVLDKCMPIEDVKGSGIYSKVKELEDRDIVALTRDEAERIVLADDRLKELKAVVAPKDEAADSRRVDDYANMRFFDPEEFVKYVRKAYGKDGGYVSIDSVVPVSVLNKANRMAQANGYNKMESKNESLPTKEEIKFVVDGLRKDKDFSRRYTVSDAALYGELNPEWAPVVIIRDKKTGNDYATIVFDGDSMVRIINDNPYSPFAGDSSDVEWMLSILKKGNDPSTFRKSESLTLKQKELKDMARYGEAEDITTISDAEAKELKKKGIETVGVSRGTYGMNGALLRDREGNKYVITARSSNLFYFV